MPDLWEYIKGLFQEEAESSPSQPFIHELIERSEEEKEAYELWKRTLSIRRLLDWINLQYASFLATGEANLDTSIDILNTPSSKGFVLHFDTDIHNVKNFKHLLDYLKERVLTINYKSYVSDNRTYSKTGRNGNTWVENVQRHYLKPRVEITDDDKMIQQYGNIKIELLTRNDEIRNLKFSATHYSDHKFTVAESFQDLMTLVLK